MLIDTGCPKSLVGIGKFKKYLDKKYLEENDLKKMFCNRSFDLVQAKCM